MKPCLKCGVNKKFSEYYKLHSTCISCTKIKKYKLRDLGYDCWRAMQSRCTNKNNPSWKYYGGKSRFVCPRLSNTFEDFIAVIGKRPGLEYSIDRIDNNGNYTCGDCFWCLKNGWPLNVSWATSIQQAKNRGRRKPRSLSDNSHRGITVTKWGKYRVRISLNGTMTNLGNFDNLQEAIRARNKIVA